MEMQHSPKRSAFFSKKYLQKNTGTRIRLRTHMVHFRMKPNSRTDNMADRNWWHLLFQGCSQSDSHQCFSLPLINLSSVYGRIRPSLPMPLRPRHQLAEKRWECYTAFNNQSFSFHGCRLLNRSLSIGYIYIEYIYTEYIYSWMERKALHQQVGLS